MNFPKALNLFYALGLDTDVRLNFTDMEWKPKNLIGSDRYHPLAHPSLTAFAFTARRDEWSLFPDRASVQEPEVVLFGKESDAELYAPTFSHFLTRACIEEFAHTWQVDTEDDLPAVERRLFDYPGILEPVIGKVAAQKLSNLIAGRRLRMVAAGDSPGFLSDDEMNAAIEEMIGKDYLNQELVLDTEDPRYSGGH
jgi:hypothetical protein